jgi:hypothetical protein
MDPRHAGGADVESLPGDPDEAELVARVRESEDTETVKTAIRELARRRSPQRSQVLTDVLRDRKRDPGVRTTVAVELGRQAEPAHREALLDAMKGAEPSLARRAAEALGRIGDEEAYASLRRLRPRDPVVQQSVAFARTLISYRLGLDRDLLDAPRPPQLPAGQRGQPMDIDFATPSEASVREALTAAEEEFPTVPLSADGALHFSCAGDQFFVAFNGEVQGRDTLTPLGEHNAVLMTVMRRPEVLERYGAYLYILTHPEREERLRLFGVRTTGAVVLTGEVRLSERRASFRVGALPSPLQVPVTVEATYDHTERRIDFVETVIDADFLPGQKRSRQPSKSAPPGS